jgi:hypothetical protein
LFGAGCMGFGGHKPCDAAGTTCVMLRAPPGVPVTC